LIERSGLPGARLNLWLVAAFAAEVGRQVGQPGEEVEQIDALAALLDGWAALPPEQAPGDGPAVILPCAAVAAYGRVGAARPDWWDDEIAKLRRAAGDSRWRVREVVAQAVQTLLAADWDRTVAELRAWAADPDPWWCGPPPRAWPNPRCWRPPPRQARRPTSSGGRVDALRRIPAADRRHEPVRGLRTALGFTVSVATAATGDFDLLDEMASSGDADLRWAARHNAKKARLRAWPDHLAHLRQLLDP
jgi:hypothetical protein